MGHGPSKAALFFFHIDLSHMHNSYQGVASMQLSILKSTMRKRIALPISIIIFATMAQAQTMAPMMMDRSKMDYSAHMEMVTDAQRQAEVSERSTNVMPFSLAATTHIFTKNAEGGVQRVAAKVPSDKAQEKLIRKHLQEIRAQFLQGDFSGPNFRTTAKMPWQAMKAC